MDYKEALNKETKALDKSLKLEAGALLERKEDPY